MSGPGILHANLPGAHHRDILARMPSAPSASEPSPRVFTRGRLVALLAGPTLAAIILALQPGGLTTAGTGVLAVGVWMATWWITECLPLAVTALLPIAVFPLLGVGTVREAASPFANEVVFLYLGGFLLAAALEHWHAHHRIALSVIGT